MPSDGQALGRTRKGAFWWADGTAAAFLCAGLLTNTLLPREVAGEILYAAATLVALWSRDERRPYFVAFLAVALTLIDLWVVGPATMNIGEIVNHGLVIAVSAGAALVCFLRGGSRQSTIEAALKGTRKELEDLKYALDQSTIVAITDQRGVITYVNDKFCEISKFTESELVGSDHRIVNSGYHSKDYIRDLWKTIGRGKVWKGELRNRAKDGTVYWVDTTIVPFLDSRGKPYQYLAVRSDITERKRGEAALREQAALARLGEMAAVVAHEVKNPLAGIRGAIQVIRDRLPVESDDRDILKDIIGRIDALNAMVKDMLVFAHPKPPQSSAIGIRAVLDDTVRLFTKDAKQTEIHVEIGGVDCEVLGDPELLRQVFLNLLLNAAHAMRGVGVIEVLVVEEGAMCAVRVHDSGPGIAVDIRDQVFEPFFTTKNRGTGLGLPIARRIIQGHGGDISLETTAGGTTLVVKLPKQQTPVGGSASVEGRPFGGSTGRGEGAASSSAS